MVIEGGRAMYNITCLKTVTAVATLVAATAIFTSAASANPFNPFEALFGPQREPVTAPAYANPQEDASEPRDELRRQIVNYRTSEAPGTGVGREGFTWSGVKTVERKAEWPDWTPPPEMIHRQPYLPRFVAGGPSNPLGARAMYLSGSVYRIHGTNDPSTIGGHVSSGCIRLVNEDVIDLYSRVHVGTKVVVLPMSVRRASTATDSIN
jgi:lipoprotein-anchoring transpeptidase ErfK/SrfK